MKILLYNPDNEVTYNFMPHLWMFLLKALTPSGHEVILVDGNAQRMTVPELVDYIIENKVGLVGIGAMTRMIAKAYRVADAVRAAGVKVVMGGPHVTAVPEEALGTHGGLRHADAVALGEADEVWPKIVADAERGMLKDVYSSNDDLGQESECSLDHYPEIPWEDLDLRQFDLIRFVPSWARRLIHMAGFNGGTWKSFHMIPVETGRGCPYGCEFCTVTKFFGDSIRYRTNESVVNELLRLKALAKRQGGKIGVFFIDDNLAIDIKRTKSLLREVIARRAQLPWVAQISVNLLKDEELVSLIARSGGKWIFVGLESIESENLRGVNKGFNKPEEYREAMESLARHNVYAINSFILGMDGDRPGVAQRIVDAIQTWPPGLPVFGQLTPYPATPLYDKLASAGRLTRPKHWLDFHPFLMAFEPLGMSTKHVGMELRSAWQLAYDPAATASGMKWLKTKPLGDRALYLLARLIFRGIYFPQMTKRVWVRLLYENRAAILRLLSQAVVESRIQGLPETISYEEPPKELPRERFDQNEKRAQSALE